jgi:hypothetical protein
VEARGTLCCRCERESQTTLSMAGSLGSARGAQRTGVQQRVGGAVAGRARDGRARRRLLVPLHPGDQDVEGGPEAGQHRAQALRIQAHQRIRKILGDCPD